MSPRRVDSLGQGCSNGIRFSGPQGVSILDTVTGNRGHPIVELPLTAPAWVFLTIVIVILGAPILAERARLPGVIGLVVGGVAVGPEGLGLLAREGMLEQVGGFGLLYLMFLVGLELDRDVLQAHRRPAVGFGLLTFAIPMSMGAMTATVMGFGIATSVLIGCVFASHTLVVYPVVRRSGIVADPAVAASVGATLITDTLALIVLAVVAEAFVSGGGWDLVIRLLAGLPLLAVSSLWLLPRIARWFFTGLGQDRTLRFLFVLVAFLGSAVLAEVVGVEGIVGAFLAGLALNPLVPNRGVLMQRVEFVGSAILIPIFLVSVGMLVDLGIVTDPATMGLAFVFAAVAVGAKWLAAEVAGRWFHFDRPQIELMFALSSARAAAALAATFVGFEVGLFDQRVVNAILLVVLISVVTASWVGARSAPRVAPPAPASGRLGRMVLVPVSNPDGASDLIRLAVWVAQADGGDVVPFHVVTSPDPARVEAAGPLVSAAERAGARFGAEVDAHVRVDRSVASGVLNSVVERDASLVMIGWKGATTTQERLFGSLFDDIVDRAPCVVAACRAQVARPQRIVLIPMMDRDTPLGDTAVAIEMCRRLAKGSGLPVVVVQRDGLGAVSGIDPVWATAKSSPELEGMAALIRAGDLVVVPGTAGRSLVSSFLSELTTAIPDLNLVVVHRSTPLGMVEVGEVFAVG